jgi:adenylosuccinate synthase
LLPAEAKKMVENIENGIKIPVSIISTGADAEATIDRRKELGLI